MGPEAAVQEGAPPHTLGPPTEKAQSKNPGLPANEFRLPNYVTSGGKSLFCFIPQLLHL